MATQVGVAVTATVAHRKAQSACHGAPLNRAPEEAPHDYTCRQCGQPTERVLGEPRHVQASGSGVMTVPAAEGSEG